MKWLMLLLAFVAAPVAAQAPVIAQVSIQLFTTAQSVTGTPTAVQTVVWPLAAGSCNLPISPTPTGTVTTPRFVVFDDPAFPAQPSPLARECRIDFAAFFASTLVAGTSYKATSTFTYTDSVVSARSNATGPFDGPVVQHPAPTGVGVR